MLRDQIRSGVIIFYYRTVIENVCVLLSALKYQRVGFTKNAIEIADKTMNCIYKNDRFVQRRAAVALNSPTLNAGCVTQTANRLT